MPFVYVNAREFGADNMVGFTALVQYNSVPVIFCSVFFSYFSRGVGVSSSGAIWALALYLGGFYVLGACYSLVGLG